MAKDINRVIYNPGGAVTTKSGDTVKGQEDAGKVGADCGCGIDCCNKKLVLTDQVTSVQTDIYIENGSLIVEIDGVKYSATLVAED